MSLGLYILLAFSRGLKLFLKYFKHLDDRTLGLLDLYGDESVGMLDTGNSTETGGKSLLCVTILRTEKL